MADAQKSGVEVDKLRSRNQRLVQENIRLAKAVRELRAAQEAKDKAAAAAASSAISSNGSGSAATPAPAAPAPAPAAGKGPRAGGTQPQSAEELAKAVRRLRLQKLQRRKQAAAAASTKPAGVAEQAKPADASSEPGQTTSEAKDRVLNGAATGKTGGSSEGKEASAATSEGQSRVQPSAFDNRQLLQPLLVAVTDGRTTTATTTTTTTTTLGESKGDTSTLTAVASTARTAPESKMGGGTAARTATTKARMPLGGGKLRPASAPLVVPSKKRAQLEQHIRRAKAARDASRGRKQSAALKASRKASARGSPGQYSRGAKPRPNSAAATSRTREALEAHLAAAARHANNATNKNKARLDVMARQLEVVQRLEKQRKAALKQKQRSRSQQKQRDDARKREREKMALKSKMRAKQRLLEQKAMVQEHLKAAQDAKAKKMLAGQPNKHRAGHVAADVEILAKRNYNKPWLTNAKVRAQQAEAARQAEALHRRQLALQHRARRERESKQAGGNPLANTAPGGQIAAAYKLAKEQQEKKVADAAAAALKAAAQRNQGSDRFFVARAVDKKARQQQAAEAAKRLERRSPQARRRAQQQQRAEIEAKLARAADAEKAKREQRRRAAESKQQGRERGMGQRAHSSGDLHGTARRQAEYEKRRAEKAAYKYKLDARHGHGRGRGVRTGGADERPKRRSPKKQQMIQQQGGAGAKKGLYWGTRARVPTAAAARAAIQKQAARALAAKQRAADQKGKDGMSKSASTPALYGGSNGRNLPAYFGLGDLKRRVRDPNYKGGGWLSCYKVDKKLGAGSFGTVRLAYHKLTGHKVAIKIYDKNKFRDKNEAKRAQREVYLMSILNHNNVARIFECFETHSRMYLVMEFAEGGNLQQHLRKVMDEPSAKRMFKPLMQAMEVMHGMGIVHRDIKLENLLLDHTRTVLKITDFGFSSELKDPERQRLKMFCGTPSYMAPEIIRRKPYRGTPVDVWSLGVVIYACTCGRFPFRGKYQDELYKKILRGSYRVPGHVSNTLADLFHRMIRPNVEKRYSVTQCLAHPWFTDKAIVMGPQPNPYGLADDVEANLMEECLAQCEQCGYPRDQVVRAIRAKRRNQFSLAYSLLFRDLRRKHGQDWTTLPEVRRAALNAQYEAKALAAAAAAARQEQELQEQLRRAELQQPGRSAADAKHFESKMKERQRQTKINAEAERKAAAAAATAAAQTAARVSETAEEAIARKKREEAAERAKAKEDFLAALRRKKEREAAELEAAMTAAAERRRERERQRKEIEAEKIRQQKEADAEAARLAAAAAEEEEINVVSYGARRMFTATAKPKKEDLADAVAVGMGRAEDGGVDLDAMYAALGGGT